MVFFLLTQKRKASRHQLQTCAHLLFPRAFHIRSVCVMLWHVDDDTNDVNGSSNEVMLTYILTRTQQIPTLEQLRTMLLVRMLKLFKVVLDMYVKCDLNVIIIFMIWISFPEELLYSRLHYGVLVLCTSCSLYFVYLRRVIVIYLVIWNVFLSKSSPTSLSVT